MKKKIISLFALSFCVVLSGCGKSENNGKASDEKIAETDIVSSEKEDIQVLDSSFFPTTYVVDADNVRFNCILEIPEEFDAYNFHVPEITGYSYLDLDKAYSTFVEGNVVKEEYHDPPTADYEIAADGYILEDDTTIFLNGGITYYKPNGSTYRTISRATERNAPKDEFDFASGEACVQKVKETLAELGCPVEDYRFDWFSTSGEDYSIMEQRAVDDGALDSRYVNQAGWTDNDNAYEIFAWQMYEGLPIFPQIMTTSEKRALENYKKAPISALFTAEGMLDCALLYPTLVFEDTEEKIEFLPFTEIADVIINKYDELLEEEGTYHEVTRAKLAIRTYYDEKQEMAAEPIWYFEITDNGSSEISNIILINAITGDEIYLTR